jgi:hypothetical protein
MSDEKYVKLVYKLGSLHALLVECAAEGLYQGDHTIAYNLGGVSKTLYVHIQGTRIEISDSPARAEARQSTNFAYVD